jgi:hypothetical protein
VVEIMPRLIPIGKLPHFGNREVEGEHPAHVDQAKGMAILWVELSGRRSFGLADSAAAVIYAVCTAVALLISIILVGFTAR